MNQNVFQIVEQTLLELNEELEYESLKNITEDTPVFGGEFGIDSLSLVRLVSEIEMNISETFSLSISLADQKAMSMRQSPYRTVGALVEFIEAKLGETKDG